MSLRRDSLGKMFGIALVLTVTIALSPARAIFIDPTPTTAINSATSVRLSDLISGNPNDGIIVGDKTMSEFVYSATGDMPSASDVRVLGFRDLDGNWGITFQGAFLDLPGGGNSDAAI